MSSRLQRLGLPLTAIALCLPPGINLLQYWLHNPLYGFGIWVPFLAGFLFWQRRGILEGAHSSPECLGGALPCAVNAAPRRRGSSALQFGMVAIVAIYLLCIPLFRVIQIANPDWRMLDWILALGAFTSLLALFYQVGGRRLVAEFWFPSAFLLTAIPWSTAAERDFIAWAIPATGKVASELLWTLGVAAVDAGKTLYTAAGPIQVSEDCSGIRSIHLATMVTLFWAGYFRLRFQRACLLAALALGLTLSLNILRVAALVYVAVKDRPEAMHQWHDLVGSIAQGILVLGLPAIAWLVSEHKGQAPQETVPLTPLEPPSQSVVCERFISKAWIPLVILAWLLIGEVLAEGWFRLHESTTPLNSGYWDLNLQIPGGNVVEASISDNVKENYFFSAGHKLTWNDAAGAPWSILYLDFDQGSLSACTHNVHRPEVCLPMADFNLVQTLPPLKIAISGKELSFAHQSFEKGGQLLHLFHAYLQNVEQENSLANWTYQGRLRAAKLGIRSHRAELVHLIVQAPYSPENARAAAADYLKQLLARRTN